MRLGFSCRHLRLVRLKPGQSLRSPPLALPLADVSIRLSVRLVSLQGLIHDSGLYQESLLHSRERKKKKKLCHYRSKNLLRMYHRCFADEGHVSLN